MSNNEISHVTYPSGREYWQFEEPRECSGMQEVTLTYHVCIWIANPSTVRRCEGQEDPNCSCSIRKCVHLFCALLLNWFCSIDRNQPGARSVFWTRYVQRLKNAI
jgi:hypothetical protein